MVFEGRIINELQKDETLRRINFDAFKERYGCIPSIDEKEDELYRMGKAINGEPVLYIKNSNGADLRLNSLYNPSYEAYRWSEDKYKTRRKTTVAMLGISTGVYLSSLLEKMRPDTFVYVYEPSESLFSYLCCFVDFSGLIEMRRVSIFVTNSQKRLYAEMLTRDITAARANLYSFVTPYYSNVFEFDNACESAIRIMNSNRDYLKSMGRLALRARLYAWNHIEGNTFITQLRNAVRDDLYAVIVAAGPSLDKNVEVLKRIKDHALIICTDRAVSVLNEHEIVPDMVASFDTDKASEYMKYVNVNNVPLLCSYQVNIDTQKMFQGRIIYMHALSYENKLLGEVVGDRSMSLDLGGNVAGGSFVACLMLGIKNIVLIGQDLAFENGRHHADDGIERGIPNSEFIEVPDIHGEMVQTVEMWLLFKDFYERQISMHPELNVIDATEGGAYIKGTKIMTLAEVADDIKGYSYSFETCWDKVPKALACDYKDKVHNGLCDLVLELDTIKAYAEELYDISEQLIKISRYGDITSHKTKGKLGKLEEILVKMYELEAYRMLKEFWIKDMYSTPTRYLMFRSKEEAEDTLVDLMSFLKKLPDDCDSLKGEIVDSMS